MTNKNEMKKYLLNQFKKNNKKSKFLLEDLREYTAFLNRKSLSELKEIYNRQLAINSISDNECLKELCMEDLF